MYNNKKTIKLLGKEYTVDFPSMGQYTAIEGLKNAYTSGQYGSMARGAVGIPTQERVLDFIDAFATFSIIIPDFNKETKFNTPNDVDVKTGRQITNSYNKYYKPWHDAIMKELNDIEEDFDALQEIENESSKETAE